MSVTAAQTSMEWTMEHHVAPQVHLHVTTLMWRNIDIYQRDYVMLFQLNNIAAL